jgi:nucleoside-diphosphate-sugar epimerase
MIILITGGAGFVPSSLADKLLENPNNKVVLLDNFLTGLKENIPIHENCTFFEGDANDFEVVKNIYDQFQFDYVFHYAAVVGVKRTLANPLLVLEDIQGFKNVLELSRLQKVKRVFFSSSSEVYGEPVHLPQNEETTPLNSRLPYAIVKNVGESFFKSYFQEFGLEYTIFRFFNTYGPKQSPDFVMSKFIQAALKNEDITIYGDGSQTRTFCYIDDNIEACLATMEDKRYANDIFNIGNDKISTIKELAETIIRLTGSKSKIVNLPPLPEGDMTRRQPDITKMKQILNRDLLSLEDGIKKVLANWEK